MCIETMKPTLGYFNRWYLANSLHPELAWTGARWASHNRGLAGISQISNFATEDEAFKYIDSLSHGGFIEPVLEDHLLTSGVPA